MPIINSYPNDINVQDKDAWIGTDSYNRQTKQYTAEAVAKYLNIKGKVSIAGQINYKFVDTPFDGSGTMAFAAGSGDGTPFSSITEFKISKSDLSGQQVTEYLDYLVGREIIIVDQNATNSFGHYSIYTYAINPNNDQYYDITISFIGGNGSISVDSFYSIANFTFGGAASTIATLTNIGIGNVNPSTYPTLKGLTTSYNNGTATIGLNIQDLPNTTIPTSASDILVPWAAEVSGVTYNSKATLQDLIDDTGIVGGPYLPLTGGTLTGDLYVNTKVGIGTASPSEKLEVDGNIKLNQYGRSIYFGSTVNEIKGDSSNFLYKSFSKAEWDNAGTYTNSSYVFKQSGSEVFRIDTGGNVGIGTTSPSEKLDIEGNVRVGQNNGFYINNQNVGIKRDSNDLVLGGFGNVIIKSSNTTVVNQAERMRITSSGNVGIGTTSPSYGLDIHKSSNAFRVANSGGYEVFGVNPSAAIPTRIFGRAAAYASLVSSHSYEALDGLLAK